MLRFTILLVLVGAVLVPADFAQANGAAAPTAPSIAPLPLDTVVDNLIHKNEERARALRSSEATRIYHLVYRGFPGDREAEMTVHATYESPDTKDFKVISESGSKLILNRVFKKLLESEVEAARPDMRTRLQMNRANYDFAMVGYDAGEGRYVLQITPKSKSKYVYHGKIWVDAADFAITRIEAEPAQNPSFWTKKSEILHDYVKVQGFWLPSRNQSNSDIRLGGHATLTIEYRDYKVKTALDSPPISVSASDQLTWPADASLAGAAP